MAIDVVVRPDGRCLTVVCDYGTVVSDHIIISGPQIGFRKPNGDTPIGVLSGDMLNDAMKCEIAFVVIMDGDYVHSSKQAKLSFL